MSDIAEQMERDVEWRGFEDEERLREPDRDDTAYETSVAALRVAVEGVAVDLRWASVDVDITPALLLALAIRLERALDLSAGGET